MVLNFGGSQLFNTSLEERWKGVFEDRKEEVSSAVAAIGDSQLNLDTDYEDITGATVTINVKPDQKVLVLATAGLDQDTYYDLVSIRILRNGVPIGVHGSIYTDGADNVRIKVMASINYLDDPGEGTHVYKMQGKSYEGTGDAYNPTIIAIAVGIN